jgi:hypothetical protein
MGDDLNHRDNLQEIKMTALSLMERINSADAVDVQNAMVEYAVLVDRFYEVDENLAPHQYKAAKIDFEYFMRLLDLAMRYSTTSDRG